MGHALPVHPGSRLVSNKLLTLVTGWKDSVPGNLGTSQKRWLAPLQFGSDQVSSFELAATKVPKARKAAVVVNFMMNMVGGSKRFTEKVAGELAWLLWLLVT